jgi:phospholipid transport system substrate-binding protein
MRMRRFLLGGVVVLSLSAPAAPADSPTAALRSAVDAAIQILQDPALKGDARVKERRLALSRVAEQAFDFPEIARRVLGRYWRERTAGEREEFTTLFRELVELTYSSLLDRYAGEKVVYLDESVDGDFARVQTNILTPRGTVVPVAYSVLEHDGRWLIVDISVENVSYVVNYRSQFNEIIQASSFPALLKRLRAKVEELRRGESARARGRTE